jgi:elongation factor P
MKMNANLIRPGWVIENNGKQYSVIKIQLIQPGKGGAFIQVEMRDVQTGLKTNDRWRTADTVEKLNAEGMECQYMYVDGESVYFMNNDTFEQFAIPADVVGEKVAFLSDGQMLNVNFIEGNPVSVDFPKTAICEIAETDAVVKGQTASGAGKPAILTNGVKIMVPLFIESGEKVVVNIEECAYMERAK